jgi:hypothetical protein
VAALLPPQHQNFEGKILEFTGLENRQARFDFGSWKYHVKSTPDDFKATGEQYKQRMTTN